MLLHRPVPKNQKSRSTARDLQTQHTPMSNPKNPQTTQTKIEALHPRLDNPYETTSSPKVTLAFTLAQPGLLLQIPGKPPSLRRAGRQEKDQKSRPLGSAFQALVLGI